MFPSQVPHLERLRTIIVVYEALDVGWRRVCVWCVRCVRRVFCSPHVSAIDRILRARASTSCLAGAVTKDEHKTNFDA